MKIINISFLTISLLLLCSTLLASSGNYEPCNRRPYSSSYSQLTNELYIGCSGGRDYLQLIVTDPTTLNLKKDFTVDGLVHEVIPINNGSSLLVILIGVEDNGPTEDGVLRQIAYSDGHIENEYTFTTNPLALVVDSQEQYAYVSSGLAHMSVDPIITKIDLSTFQRVGNDVEYGQWSNYIALTHDDSKLYVKSERAVRIDEDHNHFFEIGVFNTSDMSPLPSIEIDVKPAVIKMGHDERLYVSSWIMRGVQTPLLVIDTDDDTVTPINFEGVGFWDICVDEVNHKLYCQIHTEDTSRDYGFPLFIVSSNMVYQIDIENQYSYQVFTVADENISMIEAVPIDDPVYSCRIFAVAGSGPKVHFLDVN